MGTRVVGVAARAGTATETILRIERMEALGIDAAWLGSGGAGPDALTLLSAAASNTERILLGTSVTRIYPRHPLVVAQQAQVIAELAPRRCRIGVGTSHRPHMKGMFGLSMKDPLGHLREYIRILRTLFRDSAVEFDGRYYSAHASIARPLPVPVMASALRRQAFALCGAEADGAISWMCPQSYLREAAVPAIGEGSRAVGRKPPPLIAHVPLCLHQDVGEVRAAVREQCPNPQLPYYQKMFVEAGFPEATSGQWSDAMIDAVVCWGREEDIAERVRGLFDIGASEILVSVILAGRDPAAATERTLRFVAELSRELNSGGRSGE